MRCSSSAPWVLPISLASSILVATACQSQGLQGAKAEVKDTPINLVLPEVPEFQMPSAHPDGTHSVREMRLKGRKLFNTEQKIRGYITWIYDCVAALHTPELDEKKVQKMIIDDPSRCTRPHFYIGDSADTPPEKSLWVVEVPRKLRPDEIRNMSRQDRRNLPKVPSFHLGDEVTITGTWDRSSPAGFANSEGLLVYKSMTTVTEGSAQGGSDETGDDDSDDKKGEEG